MEKYDINFNDPDSMDKLDRFIDIQIKIKTESNKLKKVKVPLIGGLLFINLCTLGAQSVSASITVGVVSVIIGWRTLDKIKTALNPPQQQLALDINKHPEIFEACIQRLQNQIDDLQNHPAKHNVSETNDKITQKQIAIQYFQTLLSTKPKGD